MTAPLTAPVEGPSVDLCPLCRTAITDDLSETLSKRVVMMVVPPGGVVYVHTLCCLSMSQHASRPPQRCGRCGEFLTGESESEDGPRRMHGIGEEGRYCGDGFATTDPRPYIDPYLTIAPSAAA